MQRKQACYSFLWKCHWETFTLSSGLNHMFAVLSVKSKPRTVACSWLRMLSNGRNEYIWINIPGFIFWGVRPRGKTSFGAPSVQSLVLMEGQSSSGRNWCVCCQLLLIGQESMSHSNIGQIATLEQDLRRWGGALQLLLFIILSSLALLQGASDAERLCLRLFLSACLSLLNATSPGSATRRSSLSAADW